MADLTRSEAWELLTKYNKEPFHLRHALTVEGIMKYFAKELGYADEADFWAQVGLLHDLDFEVYPAEHCLKSQEIMREHGLDERSALPPATATAWRKTISNRSTRWKRCCSLSTSFRD